MEFFPVPGLPGRQRHLPLRPYRYIELTSVRAAMVSAPGDYRWSSHAFNAYCTLDPLPQPHPAYLALGADPRACQQAHRMLVREALTPDDLDAIRLRLQRQHALGPDRFRRAIEAQLSRPAGPEKIGRPTQRRSALNRPIKSEL